MNSSLIFEDGRLPLESGRVVSHLEFFKQYPKVIHGAAQGMGIEIILPFELKGKNKKYEQVFIKGQSFKKDHPVVYKQYINYLKGLK